MRKAFFNIFLDVISRKDSLDTCSKLLAGKACKTIFFVNAHCFNVAQKNPDYRKALNNSDLILNDGIGLKIGSFFAGIRLEDNLNGTDLIPEIIEQCVKQNKKIYLIGSKPNVVTKAKAALLNEFKTIKIAGTHDGFFTDADERQIIFDINDSKPDVLIVGMGVPRQELWIDKIKNELVSVKICIAGGAIIDFTAGVIKRAPKWMRRLNIEWIYRLYLEPGRMWKRYLIGNFRFFWYIFLHLIKSKKIK